MFMQMQYLLNDFTHHPCNVSNVASFPLQAFDHQLITFFISSFQFHLFSLYFLSTILLNSFYFLVLFFSSVFHFFFFQLFSFFIFFIYAISFHLIFLSFYLHSQYLFSANFKQRPANKVNYQSIYLSFFLSNLQQISKAIKFKYLLLSYSKQIKTGAFNYFEGILASKQIVFYLSQQFPFIFQDQQIKKFIYKK
ncbi:transmembrane protein, putative (macronuclear) [Tetrahymena thermophila SB210]|uniref:Transmembrane protein, putative n=1 Tax=Tetrahymena thermophila (strain SB210) TaxID=312017 RepID=W7X3D3_TETTS|nr:transmembrane protein, putative [Tetrahymena thermophila SB210]EWS71957.1 transmembrane protein, putative [Tetrahymena thermophila SB210]|eukprot:XP_012655517.1 transmembrane protein, putative [Tetrahymena thermophila SB210]